MLFSSRYITFVDWNGKFLPVLSIPGIIFRPNSGKVKKLGIAWNNFRQFSTFSLFTRYNSIASGSITGKVKCTNYQLKKNLINL